MRAQLRNLKLTRRTFSLMAALLDLAVILWTAISVESIYNNLVYGWNGFAQSNLTLCFFVAFLFVASNVLRRGYSISAFLEMSGHAQRVFLIWNMAFLCAVFLGFIQRRDRG